MAKAHTCKFHDHAHNYTKHTCGCEYCALYWKTCPRCFEREHGHHSYEQNMVATTTELLRCIAQETA
jgi:hypothetical protein